MIFIKRHFIAIALIIVSVLIVSFILKPYATVEGSFPSKESTPKVGAIPKELTAMPKELLDKPNRMDSDTQKFMACFKASKSYEDTQKCYSAARESQIISFQTAIGNLGPKELTRYTIPSGTMRWEPHEILYPTLECNMEYVSRVGAPGDGGKWMCGEYLEAKDDCVIFSLGSNGQFDFEESIDAHTKGKCKIHTFDCTGVWQSNHTTFHSWCLGPKDEVIGGRTFKTLSSIVKDLGVSKITLLKMDIEDYEWRVFESLLTENPDYLPTQILFELHFGYTRNVVVPDPVRGWMPHALYMANALRQLGYKIAFRERNHYGGTATEYVIVRA